MHRLGEFGGRQLVLFVDAFHDSATLLADIRGGFEQVRRCQIAAQNPGALGSLRVEAQPVVAVGPHGHGKRRPDIDQIPGGEILFGEGVQASCG